MRKNIHILVWEKILVREKIFTSVITDSFKIYCNHNNQDIEQ